VAIERFIYRPLVARAGATALLAVFVASLGIGIAGENIIRLLWSSSSQNFFGPAQKRWSLGSVTFLNFDIWQTLTSFGLVVLLALLLRFTPLGRQIKATRVNPELATVIGINANTIYLVCFAIGTFFAAVAAFWYAVQYTIIPDMGQRPIIFAFVVAFLAGTASGPIRVFFAGIVVALLEQWTQTAVFVLLLAYLVAKSLEGKHLIRRLIPDSLQRTA
jgi:branched-subunit amino acid ABC-type transport system permease component